MEACCARVGTARYGVSGKVEDYGGNRGGGQNRENVKAHNFLFFWYKRKSLPYTTCAACLRGL